MRNLFSLIILILCSTNLFGQTSDTYKNVGDSKFAAGLFKTAIDNYDNAIKKNNAGKAAAAELYYKVGLCQDSLRQFDVAIKAYTTSISLDPTVPNVYWSRAYIYSKNTKFQLSINDYLKVISLTNNKLSLSQLYGNIALDELDLKEADKAMASDSIAISLYPSASAPYIIMGNIHNFRKEYGLAMGFFTKAMSYTNEFDNKKLSQLYANRGIAKNGLKKYKDAINDFSYALLLNNQNRVAYWDRGASYHYNGDYILAADDYTKAISFYKDSNTDMSKLYDDRAVNETRQSLLTPAIQDDSTAIALDPDNKSAYFNQAIAYTQNGDYQKAIDRYRQVLNLTTDNNKLKAYFYFCIANDEYFLGEFDKVISDCSRSLSIDTSNASSYFYRGKVYLKKLNDKSLAIKDFNKVLQLDTTRKSVNYIFSTFYTGNGDKAIAILKDNLLNAKENSGQLSAYYNLACLYSLMNKPDEANVYLKISVDKGYSKKYIIADEDLDNIRKTDDYKAIMNNPVAAN